MSLKQLTAGIMGWVFALSFAGTQLATASDKGKEENRSDRKETVVAVKEQPKKEHRSLWETRPMIPSGPKY